MTRMFGVAAFCLLAAVSARAAEVDHSAKLAVNLAKLDVPSGWDVDSKTGVTVGYALSVSGNDTVSFQTGVQYAMKGGEVNSDMGVEKYNINMVEIPALARFSLARGKASATAGLNLGIITTAENEDPSGAKNEMTNAADLNVDLVVGAGVRLMDGKFDIALQYELGVTDLSGDSSSNGDVKSRNLQLCATYRF